MDSGKQEMAGRRALRGARGGSNNAFTAGNGHHPGATPGTREEPGDRPLARVPGPGGRRAARGEDQATGQPARRGRARPLHLIHGGAVPDSARQERVARAGTPATAGMPAAMIGGPAGHGRGSRAAAPGGAGEPPRRQRPAGPPECEPARLGAAPSRAGTPPGPAPRHRPLPAGDQRLNLVVDGDRRLPLRLVAVVAQAGRRWRRLSPGSLSVSGTRRRDHGERDGRQALGTRAACPAGCAASIRCPPSGAMHPGPGQIRVLVPAASRKHRHADPLPASPARERVAGFAVHNHVDHLCKTAPGLCAHWGNAGDRVTGPRP